MREERKLEHIENYLKTSYAGDTLFSNVYLPHHALPDWNMDEIRLDVEFLGKPLKMPLMINAMTGGNETTHDINEDLARLAKKFGLAIAVGSQTVALENLEMEASFRVVRERVGKDGVVIANLSANRTLEDAKRAIEMIEADALQLHLNPLQELVMKEGDRDFKGISKNIERMVASLDVPVIVKEVGAGLSAMVVERLLGLGVRWIDVAGHGGTNFVEIENLRRFDMDFSDLYEWGVPTAKAIMDARAVSSDFTLIGSGGLRTGQDVVKALVLGADMVGMSGEILSYLMHGGIESARDFLATLQYKMKLCMMLLNCPNVRALRQVEYKTFGKLKELL